MQTFHHPATQDPRILICYNDYLYFPRHFLDFPLLQLQLPIQFQLLFFFFVIVKIL